MKAQILLPISIALTVASFGLMKIRLKDIINEEKKAKFQDVKLRVTGDVLKEYEKEQKDTQHLIEQGQIEKDQLEKTIKELQSGGLEARKGEVESCKGAKTTTTNEIASLEEQHKKLQADLAKEKTDWEAEVAALKQKLTTTSPVCNYLKPGSSVQDLCPEKKEEPKAEAPKAEEKKEPPKQEEKKEESKPDEKKEELKAEPPKPEEPKKEAPKPEEAKPEAPKQ